jgi:hypothetical protein
VDTQTSYRLIAKDLTRSLERVTQQPLVERESGYYLEKIGDIKSVEEFIGDSRIFRFAMKAFGLEDMTYAKGLMTKMLNEGIDDRESLANSLTDTRYKDFVDTFNFARYGATTTIFEVTKQPVVDKYVRQTLEEDAGSRNEGVRLALYFERKAPDIDSYYDILADPALAEVVRTALGYPDSIAQADIDKQVAMFRERFDLEDFKDPEKLQQFIGRFTALWELSNPSAGAQSSIAALFAQPIESGISTSLLLTLNQLKR